MQMLQRKALDEMRQWKAIKSNQALLVTGARQIGKTFIIREFARAEYKHFVEINLVEKRLAARVLDDALSAKDLMRRITLLTDDALVPGETLIFIDEVQLAKETVTAIKFLVEQGDYDFIISGSLLGVELNDIRSVPVGYLDILEMYPMDFEEFCWARGIKAEILEMVKEAYRSKQPLPDYMHEQLLRTFKEYLLVGGMPQAVAMYCAKNDFQRVRRVQKSIIQLNRRDIAQYAQKDALAIKDIYDLIPSQLNQENKRFELKGVNSHARYERYQDKFLWLIDAGVALPCYQITEPKYPVLSAKTANRFKLYSNDVGLLTSTYGRMDSIALLQPGADVNFGSTYENAIAQALTALGHSLYYYSKRKFGEVDFLLETKGGDIRLIESKSGNNYTRHGSLNKLLASPDYSFADAIVLCDDNVQTIGDVTYMPIYMMFCFEDE